MGRRLGAAGLMAVVLSCHDQVPFELPTSQLSPASGLLIFAESVGDSVWAFEGPVPSFSAPTGRSVVLLYYERDLQTLGLTAGWVALAPAGDEGRPLPPYIEGFRAQRTASGLEAWSPLGARDEILARVRLPGIAVQRCLSEQGCFQHADDLEPRICSSGCPGRLPPAAPEPPMPPTPVDFSACDPGWSPVAASGGTYCQPAEPEVCADDEAQWPSAAGCTPLGTACPSAGEWAPDLPNDLDIVFVRPGAQGGDGSRAAPLGTLQVALTVVPANGVIALTEGVYGAAVASPQGVTIWGACVAGTQLRPASPLALINGRGGLRNLSVHSPAGGLRITGRQTQVHLQDVLLSGHEVGAAIEVATSSLTLNRVRIRGTADIPTPALHATGRAYVQASSVMFDDNGGYTVWAEDQQTRVELEDAQLSAQGRVFRSRGALFAFRGAALTLRSSFVHDYRARGAVAEASGARLLLEQVVLRDIQDPDGAVGVQVSEGASADLSKLRIEGIEGEALRIEGGQVQADRLYLGAAPDGVVGHVNVVGGDLSLARSYLEESNRWGLRAADAQVVLRDVHIAQVRRTWGPEESFVGAGLWLQTGTRIDAQRLLIADMQTHGVLARAGESDPPITGSIEDLQVRAVAARGPESGQGLDFGPGARLQVRRGLIEGAANIAVYLRGGAETELTDVELRRARFGLRPVNTSVTQLTRLRVSEARAGAICVRDEAQVRAEDLILVQTLGPGEQDNEGVCADGMPAVGDGLLVNEGAFMQLQRYEISGSVATGLVSLADEAVEAVDGWVSGNRVGVQFGADTRLSSVLVRTQIYGNETDTLGIPED